MSVEMVGARECLRNAGLPEPKEPIENILVAADIEPDVIAKHGTKVKYYLTVDKSKEFISYYKAFIGKGKNKDSDVKTQTDWDQIQKTIDMHADFHEKQACEWIDEVTPQPGFYIVKVGDDKFLIETFGFGPFHYYQPGRSGFFLRVHLHDQADADEIGRKYNVELIGQQDEKSPLFLESSRIDYIRQVEP